MKKLICFIFIPVLTVLLSCQQDCLDSVSDERFFVGNNFIE